MVSSVGWSVGATDGAMAWIVSGAGGVTVGVGVRVALMGVAVDVRVGAAVAVGVAEGSGVAVGEAVTVALGVTVAPDDAITGVVVAISGGVAVGVGMRATLVGGMVGAGVGDDVGRASRGASELGVAAGDAVAVGAAGVAVGMVVSPGIAVVGGRVPEGAEVTASSVSCEAWGVTVAVGALGVGDPAAPPAARILPAGHARAATTKLTMISTGTTLNIPIVPTLFPTVDVCAGLTRPARSVWIYRRRI
jgi:hypothetical protein